MKWTRQRCQVAESPSATVALMLSWLSGIASSMPSEAGGPSIRSLEETRPEGREGRSAAGELARKGGAERPGSGEADVQPEPFPAAIGVDADADADDPAGLARRERAAVLVQLFGEPDGCYRAK